MWDLRSPTRFQTCVSCIARRTLNLWATREVPAKVFTTQETVLTGDENASFLTYRCWESELMLLLQRAICQYASRAPQIYIRFEPLLYIMHKDVFTRMLNKALFIRIRGGGEGGVDSNIRGFRIHLISQFIY